MSIHRHDARSDANQPTIKRALESIGCKVYILRQPLDLLVSGGNLGKRNLLVECKMPGEKLNITQQLFWDGWPGEKVIAESAEQAVAAVLGDMLK